MPRSLAWVPRVLASTRDYWILHLRSEAKSERTISTYLRALDRLDAFLAERGAPRALGAIRREHLEAFRVALGERGNTPATISTLFRALRPVWRWLVEEDEIERSPMERMRAPTVPLAPPPVLSDDESARLPAACRGMDLIARRDLAMLSLLLDTGIRRGELADVGATASSGSLRSSAGWTPTRWSSSARSWHKRACCSAFGSEAARWRRWVKCGQARVTLSGAGSAGRRPAQPAPSPGIDHR